MIRGPMVRRPEVVLFGMALLAFAYFYQAGGWNQNVRVDLVRALVEQQSTIIDDYHGNTGDLSCYGRAGTCRGKARAENDEHYYCDKAPGVSFLGVLPYAPMSLVAGSQKPSRGYLTRASYWITVVAVAVPSALSVSLLYLLLIALGLRAWMSALGALAYAFATLAFPYSTLLYGHQTAAALLIIAFALLVRARHTGSRPRMLLVGLALGYAVVCEYPAALAVVPITIYALVHFRPLPRLWPLFLGGALCAVVLAGYHWIAFGGPLTLPYEFSNQKYRALGYFMGLGKPNWEAFSNTLFTSYRGLFFSAPWLALAFPGAVRLWRTGRFRSEAMVCLSIFLLFVWMTSSLLESWHGGWSLGARYMIPAIPFLVVLAAAFFLPLAKPTPAQVETGDWRVRMGRIARISAGGVTLLVVAYSAWLMLAGTAVRPEVPQQIKQPFGQYLVPHFKQGELALNPQAIDMIGIPRGKPPRQAWNLGEKIGLHGHASLLPLYLMLALLGAWLVMVLRRVGPAADAEPFDPRS
jgi:hypothetical protein